MRIGVVMPAYNEERLLAATVDEIAPLVDTTLVVNDGSTDSTGDVAEACKERYGERLLVLHQNNMGASGAVLRGLRHLLDHSDVDALGIAAADRQCDPELLRVFRWILENHPEVDVAKGSRFLHQETLDSMPRFRYWGNRAISLTLQFVLGYHGMSDVLHGYLCARRRVFEEMDFSRIGSGYDLENTMMAEFRRIRCHFALVPSPSRYGDETSTIVYRRQIPKTLGHIGRTLGQRLTSGKLLDRLAPMMFATGNLPAAYLTTRLTSPPVQVFSATVPSRIVES